MLRHVVLQACHNLLWRSGLVATRTLPAQNRRWLDQIQLFGCLTETDNRYFPIWQVLDRHSHYRLLQLACQTVFQGLENPDQLVARLPLRLEIHANFVLMLFQQLRF